MHNMNWPQRRVALLTEVSKLVRGKLRKLPDNLTKRALEKELNLLTDECFDLSAYLGYPFEM